MKKIVYVCIVFSLITIFLSTAQAETYKKIDNDTVEVSKEVSREMLEQIKTYLVKRKARIDEKIDTVNAKLAVIDAE